ncbi:hypothetical protein DFH09DRAFT_1320259 [Mycena vulgaris]|nr:hypothetical protein DFH09DRAFT_1320259 [Mycena vulgaris]
MRPGTPNDVPMMNSNSSANVPPSRSRFWLARILNPALDAEDKYTHSAPAPANTPGRSLRDMQPLPSIGAAFPPVAATARLDYGCVFFLPRRYSRTDHRVFVEQRTEAKIVRSPPYAHPPQSHSHAGHLLSSKEPRRLELERQLPPAHENT